MGQQRNFSWVALILPQLEQGGLYAQLNFGAPALNQTLQDGTPIRSLTFPSFFCPSDTPFAVLPQGFGYTSYAGNGGWDGHRRLYGDNNRAGMFNLLDPVSIADVLDGTSNCVMLGEVTNKSFCCGTQFKAKSGRSRVGNGEPVARSLLVATAGWVNSHAWIDAPIGPGPLLRADGTVGPLWQPAWQSPYVMGPTYYAQYAQNVEWPGAGSRHGSGGNYAMCDGSVKSISYTIGVGNGDNLGQAGNVWTAIHFIQGVATKTAPNF